MYGRKDIVDELTSLMMRGQVVLLYGPIGIGKTSILEAVKRSIEKENRPCGFSPQTSSLSDLTAALLRAYPDIDAEGRTPRQVRSALRMAVERNPGVVLLDHLRNAGTHFKGYLASFRGTRLGAIIAADVEVPRDHDRFRAMHFAYREEKVPPLANRYLRRLLAEALAKQSVPQPLSEADGEALVKAAHGRPGWILLIAELLQNPDYWSGGRVHVKSILASVTIMINKKYWTGAEGSLEEAWPLATGKDLGCQP